MKNQIICSNCSSFIDYEDSDIRTMSIDEDGGICYIDYVVCPNCGLKIATYVYNEPNKNQFYM